MSEDKILYSPYKKSVNVIPKISLAEFLLNNVKTFLPTCASKYWVLDVISNIGIKFGDVEEYSRKVASFLHKKGFRKGNVLYYVTYETAEIFLINLAVWRLGGAVRGSLQTRSPDIIEKEILEGNSKFIVVDSITVDRIKNIDDKIMISVGHEKVKDFITFKDMLQDDGNAFPVVQHDANDPVIIPSTSGSATGNPKGVILTNFSFIGEMYNCIDLGYGDENSTVIVSASNYTIANHVVAVMSLFKGMTYTQIRYFDANTYIQYIKTYKPDYLVLFTFIASWLVRCPEFQTFDTSFIKYVIVVGAVLDKTTNKLLKEKLSKDAIIDVKYAGTEFMGISSTTMSHSDQLITANFNGNEYISCGKPLPFVSVKIVDLDNGKSLGPNQKGEIMVKTPLAMQRYTHEVTNSLMDDAGWFHTEDIGFYDENQNIFVIERKTFIYKYKSYFIAPSVIEGVLSEHESVFGVGVLGIPNPTTNSLSRAFIVLKPGYINTTEKELIKFVADRLPYEFHLHGGVRFIPELPQNKNLKLDRHKLKEIALNMK